MYLPCATLLMQSKYASPLSSYMYWALALIIFRGSFRKNNWQDCLKNLICKYTFQHYSIISMHVYEILFDNSYIYQLIMKLLIMIKQINALSLRYTKPKCLLDLHRK